ncbi:hypothetical protein [Lysobacter sp. 22409]|uniref:hypothetical protein n=1 Tax=Lysobacter sp. 22409 TaxID=3453917 RepID=UPI003F840BEB
MNYEHARRALEQLILDANQLGDTTNEATVRFRLIDSLITEVLGWDKGLVQVEKYDRGEYTDYECGSPSALIIEAKRASTHFLVPAGFNENICRIKTLCESSPGVESAISQAVDYCRQRSVPYGAICNGRQLVLFIGARVDALPSMDGKALVFLSLADMLQRFAELWNAASPAGLIEGNLGRLLKGTALPPPPLKLSARVTNYPGHKNRNPIATDLQILGGLFIEDLANAPEIEEAFLEQTYCHSGALSQYALVSKELLRTRYSTFFEEQAGVSALPATNKKGASTELTADILAAGLSRRPILLVGDVGSGKSTFIRNFIKVDAKAELKNAIVLYIDFGSKPAVVTDLRAYAVAEVIRQLREKYGTDIEEKQFVRGVHNQRIQAFGKGIYAELKEIDPIEFKKKEIEFIAGLVADKEEHLKLSLEHASKGQKRQIVVFLDNVDQRPPLFQEEVFLIAHAFATNWPVTVFVALRPETFSLSRARGTLAAYQPRVFTIEPPRIDLVVQKRLRFALNQLKEAGTLPGIKFSIQSDRLEKYLAMLIRAFETREDIIELIDNMCSGNVRRALEYVSFFVGSGHVDSQKILSIIEHGGQYVLPMHEFFRAVIYKDREHYDPSDSPFANIYDIDSNDQKEHFASLLALAFIEQAGQVGGSAGYVERDKIYRFLKEVGFQPEQVTGVLRRLVEKDLVLTPVALKGDGEDRMRITTAGAYVLKKMSILFAYLDAIIVDTPIVQSDTRQQIIDARDISERVARAELFLKYLDDSWAMIGGDAHKALDWPSLSASAKAQLLEVKRKTTLAN